MSATSSAVWKKASPASRPRRANWSG
jgi:hypothetical protein